MEGGADSTDLANESRQAQGDIKLRKSIWSLSEEELAALREAFRRAMDITDSRGYLHFGSLHGQGDPPQCEHRNQLFLPWHRAYLYVFELALQDLIPGVTLPWWDWTRSPELPPAFADETDPEGNPNSLLSAPIGLVGGVRPPGWPERTTRDPSAEETWMPGGELPAESNLAYVMAAVNYDDLTFRLEDVHNAVHVWVGGEMLDQRFAGFDPIFWSHHCMVDRLWALWQLKHPGDNPRREHLAKGFNYFRDLTVADTLDFTDLGYDYAEAEVVVLADGA